MNRNLVSLLTYTAALSQLNSLPQSLIQQMFALPGVRICDLKFIDLVLPANQCNEIYFFVSPNDDVVYVGKASSRSFVERLGGHFDLRAGNWFSSFLRKHPMKKRSRNGFSFLRCTIQPSSLTFVDVSLCCNSLKALHF